MSPAKHDGAGDKPFTHMKSLACLPIVVLASTIALTGCKTNQCCCCSEPTSPSRSGLQQMHATGVWSSSQPAAPDSIEGKLRSQGKTWTRSNDEIKAGSYVQDILEGRLNQPIGRGAIGEVVFVGKAENDQLDAMVDFGRGYRVGIHAAELAAVRIN